MDSNKKLDYLKKFLEPYSPYQNSSDRGIHIDGEPNDIQLEIRGRYVNFNIGDIPSLICALIDQFDIDNLIDSSIESIKSKYEELCRCNPLFAEASEKYGYINEYSLDAICESSLFENIGDFIFGVGGEVYSDFDRKLKSDIQVVKMVDASFVQALLSMTYVSYIDGYIPDNMIDCNKLNDALRLTPSAISTEDKVDLFTALHKSAYECVNAFKSGPSDITASSSYNYLIDFYKVMDALNDSEIAVLVSGLILYGVNLNYSYSHDPMTVHKATKINLIEHLMITNPIELALKVLDWCNKIYAINPNYKFGFKI